MEYVIARLEDITFEKRDEICEGFCMANVKDETGERYCHVSFHLPTVEAAADPERTDPDFLFSLEGREFAVCYEVDADGENAAVLTDGELTAGVSYASEDTFEDEVKAACFVRGAVTDLLAKLREAK